MEFKLTVEEFDLNSTFFSGQTSQPPWQQYEGGFQELLLIKGKPCIVMVKKENSELKVTAESGFNIKQKSVQKKIENIFDLNFNLEELYDFLKGDRRLSDTLNSSRGLRLFLAKDMFECVIASIASSNCSVLRWTRSINDIKRSWGKEYRFGGESFYSFPSPEVLSGVNEHALEDLQRQEDHLPEDFKFNDLRSCGVGYRAPYIIESSRIISEKLDLNKIRVMKYERAFETIIELPGVGPKVADCILLYGFRKMEAFPVDVWIKRIMDHLYPNENFTERSLREFARDEYGDMAGYVQLYLFNHARKSGLLKKIKKKG